MTRDLNLEDARAHLDHIAQTWSPDITFQTFDDSPAKRPHLARVLHGTLPQLSGQLEDLNRQGAGIFFTVSRTDGKGRKKSNLVAPRAAWVDLDKIDTFDWPPLQPSAVVRTGGGFHLYWLFEDAEEPISFEQLETINRAIALHMGGDHGAVDAARVLRVPGFLHCKDPSNPTLVKLKSVEDAFYSVSELLAAFPPPSPKRYLPPVRRHAQRTTEGHTRYGAKALEAELSAMRGAPEGQRNNTLNTCAFNLGQLIAGGELLQSEACADLEATAIETGLKESEVRQTIASGLRSGMASPRSAPPRPGPAPRSTLNPSPASPAPSTTPRPTSAPHLGILDGQGESTPHANSADDVLEHPESSHDEKTIIVTTSPDEPWRDSLRSICLEQGLKLTKDVGNLALILTHDARWRDCLGFDELAGGVVWTKIAQQLEGLETPELGPMLDHHWLFVSHALALQEAVTFSREAVEQAILAAAYAKRFHPIKRYLESLAWDGIERVNSWLNVYLGASRSTLTSALGKAWLVSAVKRTFEPGCQSDSMLILQGPQGCGKSTSLEILAGKSWFTDALGDLRDAKSAAETLRGKWIIEVGELDALRGADQTRIKTFLSRREDFYRPPYGRLPQKFPRRCVFSGTTNEHAYLRDASGSRRYWPVTVGQAGLADRESLERDRDQLWAESVVLYRAGAKNYIDDAELSDQLSERHGHHRLDDVWHDQVAAYLADRVGLSDPSVSIDTILSDVIDLDMDKRTGFHGNRVADILVLLGWHCKRVRQANGQRPRRWVPPGFNDESK